MRRLIFSLFGLLVLLSVGTVSAARQATPQEIEIAPGITAAPLTVADVDALPPRADLVLFARETLAPGAVLPPSSDQSVGLIYVESGEMTVTGPGPDSIVRGGGADVEPRPSGAEAVLSAGDALYVPSCSVSGARNDGTEPATVLVAGVSSLLSDACTDATPIAEGETGDDLVPLFLVAAAVDPPAALPVKLAITRLTYEPGATDPAPAANDGTVLAYIESGTFGMTIESGEGAYVRKLDDPNDFFAATQEPLIEGVEATLNPGDVLWQKSGTVFQARNTGTEPASVLIFVLAAATADEATPEA